MGTRRRHHQRPSQPNSPDDSVVFCLSELPDRCNSCPNSSYIQMKGHLSPTDLAPGASARQDAFPVRRLRLATLDSNSVTSRNVIVQSLPLDDHRRPSTMRWWCRVIEMLASIHRANLNAPHRWET